AEFQKAGGRVKLNETSRLLTVDRRRIPTAATLPAEASVEWRVTMLVPSGIAYDQYEMQFIGLTLESFKKNEAFLGDIIATLVHDEAAIGAVAPTDPAIPGAGIR
ncbi:MAG: hypothetical protein H7144_17255, partial [Burkholderiales bacterium]|nr:hypothetical protein [Phycisphaerae bacterium]